MKQLILGFLTLCFLSVGAQAANRFAVCTTTCTWDNSSTAMWSASSGGATGASAPGVSDDVTLDAATCVGGTTCTITVNANLVVNTLTQGACTGTTTGCILDFSVNNNNITMLGWSLSGTGTRTIKMGSGTWTITGTSNIVTATTSTNLTLTPGTSNLNLVPNANTTQATMLTSSSIVWGHITIGPFTNPGITSGTFIFPNTSFTIGTLSLSPPTQVLFSSTNTLTVTNAVAWTGTSGTSDISLANVAWVGGAVGSVALAAGSTMAYASINAIAFTGSPVATNSFDIGRNTGITITGPGVGGGACILGGWLLWRDMPEHLNDNFPAWLEKAV